MKRKFKYTSHIIFTPLVALALLSGGCENPFFLKINYFFTIENNSINDIMYFVSNRYPDVSIPDSVSTKIHLIRLSPNQHYTFESDKKWPKYFKSLPADTLSIFFLSPDSASKYGWKQVQSRYLILERKDISFEDLEKRKYIISYP